MTLFRSAWFCAAFIGVSALFTGCQKAEDPMTAAKAAAEARDFPTAIIHLKNVLIATPNNVDARVMLGKSMLDAGDPGGAVIEFKRARELKADDNVVVPLLAEAMLNAGNLRPLLDQFGNLELGTTAATARLKTSLALAYLAQKNVSEARRLIETAIKLNPESGEAKLARIRINLQDSGQAQALSEVDALLKTSPKLADAWGLKGRLHEMLPSEYEQAIAAFDKALELDPSQFQSLYASVTLRLSRKELKRARTALDRLAKTWPKNFNTLYLEGRLNFLEGQFSKARPIFAALLNADPENVPTLLASGLNELSLKAPIQAEAQLARVVSLAPTHMAARYYLAVAQLQLRRPDKAANALAPLLEAKDPLPEVLVVAAEARLMLGDAQGADALYTRAEKANSTDPSVRTALAWARIGKGEADAAMRELEQISQSSDSTEADLRLVSAHLSRDEVELALKALDRLEQKKPGLASTEDLRGQVLRRQKNLPGARKALEEALRRDKLYVPAISQLADLDLMEGKADLARKRLSDALAADPGNAQLMTMLGLLSVRTGGSTEEVLSLLKRATETDPLYLNAWLALMARHFSAGDNQAALNAGQTAVTLIPGNVQLMDMFGRIQLKAGEIAQASSTYASLIRVAPRSPAGYMGQAATLLTTGELEAAAKTMQRLIELDPRSIDAQRMAAEIAIRRKLFKNAMAIARNVQQQYPGESVGFSLEGEVEAAQGNRVATIAVLKKGLGKANPDLLPVRVHGLLLQDGKLAEARDFESSWIQSHPKDLTFISHLGDLALAAKDLQRARARYDQVLAIDPRHVGTLNNLAWASLQSNNSDEALKLVQRALTVQPDRPDVLDTLAEIYVSRKEYKNAIDALRRAINRSTDSAALRLSLAKVYIAANERPNAVIELERILALGKGHPLHIQARKLLAEQRRR